MFGRPRNRRRPTERALKAPATNWRAVGLTLGTVAGVAALASAVSWAFDRSEEHTLNSSHVESSYAVFCLKKKRALKHSVAVCPAASELVLSAISQGLTTVHIR